MRESRCLGISGIIGNDAVEMLVGLFQRNDLVDEYPAADALVARDDLGPIVFDPFDEECEVILARNLAALDEDGGTRQLEYNLGPTLGRAVAGPPLVAGAGSSVPPNAVKFMLRIRQTMVSADLPWPSRREGFIRNLISSGAPLSEGG